MSGQVNLRENGVLDEDLPTLLEIVFKVLSKNLQLIYVENELKNNEIELRDDVVIPNEICDRFVILHSHTNVSLPVFVHLYTHISISFFSSCCCCLLFVFFSLFNSYLSYSHASAACDRYQSVNDNRFVLPKLRKVFDGIVTLTQKRGNNNNC